nr:retrovirus-related Pol polyprotein from transposon TNT 1-94 [Tanacetum cinerariifolium]
MKEGSALKDHLDALNSILMDLKNVEVKIVDEDAALILLVSLPPSFKNFVNSFGVGKDTITLEDVRSSLHSRELQFDGGHVFMGNDSPCKVVGSGTIHIKMHDGVVRAVTHVRHVPDLKKNLISLSVLDSKGFKYTSENGVLRVSKGALVVMKATKGMVILSKHGLLDNHKATLNYLHADCWGPSRVPSLDGAWYFLSMIDDFSRMTWVFMMKHKSEAFAKFKHWKILIENHTGRKIKRVRTDNDLEFCSREYNDLCKDEGIARHYTVRYTPQ